jgi:TonB family protein
VLRGTDAAQTLLSVRSVPRVRAKEAALVALLVLSTACGAKQPPAGQESLDRPALEVDYVAAPQLEVHQKRSLDSPVVAHYQNGESVSVLAKRDGWVEIRTTDGSGWVRPGDVASTSAPAADSLTPRFRVAPPPVSSPTARGELVLEAQVNTDGDVVEVKTLTNTSGSAALENSNRVALQAAHFYPMVKEGQRIPFVYEYRVQY